MNSHESIWKKCLISIKEKVSAQSFNTWFDPIKAYRYKDNTITIQVPSQFFYEWIEEHYFQVLQEVISKQLGPTGRLEYFITKEIASPSSFDIINPNKATKKETQQHARIAAQITPLNPLNTLDRFIEGDSNFLAKSAAQAVANDLGDTPFNPLFIYGEVGLGKTHLAQGIAHEVKKNFPDNSIVYVSAERFTTQFVDSLRKNNLQDFISYFMSVDLLILDDVQFLGGKEKTQDMLFNIFNHLHQSGKQIVMTSDCKPRDLEGLEKRLLSRFKWGLTTDIKPPCLETKIAIIKSKIKEKKLNLPQDIIHYIASSVETNIRDLEGIITSLAAHISLGNTNIGLKLVKHLLEDVACHINTEINVDYLQKTVAAFYNFSVDDLRGKSRKREVVVARQVAIHFTKKYTNYSLKTIGRCFGNKDHSTIIYSLQAVENMLETDRYFRSKFSEVESMIKRGIATGV